ncbi:MAG: flagellar basal body P-ring protein FlgI [Candidatus Zixiibacteriota bacterium]
MFLLQPGSSLIANSPVLVRNLGSFNTSEPVYLTGYGLVVGLAGTGDGRGTPQTNSALANLSTQMGLQADPDELKAKNAAIVAITATSRTGSKKGDKVDVTLSSVGDAKSLAGGTLIRSFLYDLDNNMIGVAQGPISVGGYAYESGSGSSVSKNHPSVGKIPGGCLLLESIPGQIDSIINFIPHDPQPSVLTQIRTAIDSIDTSFQTQVQGNTVRINIGRMEPSEFVSMVETLQVIDSSPARVVINEKTGTVVIGGEVKLASCAVAHSDITIEISSFPEISQPLPFSEGGETVAALADSIFVTEDSGRVFSIGGEATVQELVQGLNVIGVQPRDIIAIFQAIKQAGALKAELVVM